MNEKYSRCAHLAKNQPDVCITEEEIRHMQEDANVLPLFEKHLSDLKYVKKSSLKTNEYLRCRWHEYVFREGKTRSPITLPNVDTHFKNCITTYDVNAKKKLSYHKHLVPGPGFDKYGQLPIPTDMHIRKNKNIPKPRIIKKVK